MTNEILKNTITPKNDIIFKKIFGQKGNEGILKDFLEGILNIKIESLEVDLGTEMLPDFFGGKTSKLDVRTKLSDGTNVNIEVQNKIEDYSEQRDLAYWSKLYMNSLEKGKAYTDAEKTICIWILDEEVYDFHKYHSEWIITEKELGQTAYFKDFEIHVIELQKFRKLDIIKPEKRDFWLWFIDHTRRELVDMACYSNEEVRKAKEQYDKITSDKTLMSLIIAEEIDEMDRNTRIKRAEEKGKKEAQKETVKKMLELGAEIDFIEKATGLSKEEILKLKENKE